MCSKISIEILGVLAVLVCGCSSDAPPQKSNKPVKKAAFHEPTGRVKELVEILRGNDRAAAYDAAIRLGEMKQEAVAAVPALVDVATLDDPGFHNRHPGLEAGKALTKISPEKAVPLIAEILSNPERRFWAAYWLREWGKTSDPAVPALVRAVRDLPNAATENERHACNQAAVALAAIRPRGLLVLINELTHDNPEVRSLAAWAIPRDEAGKIAVPELSRLLSDKNSKVRAQAATTLGNIGPHAKDALQFLKMRLEIEQDRQVRGTILVAIKWIEK